MIQIDERATMISKSNTSTGLGRLLRSSIKNRSLIFQLVMREFSQRYRGSLLGPVWAILTPLIMVAMFTFIFGVVFPSRWTTGPTTTQDFAIVFLCGLLVHGLFAEVISRAPSLIIGNPNYVKRVVFPLEALPLVAVATATINAAIGLAIVIAANLLFNHTLHWTTLLLPIVVIPYLLLVAGMTFAISAVGVYLRDIQQFISLIVTATLFMTPIFFPIEAVLEPSDFCGGSCAWTDSFRSTSGSTWPRFLLAGVCRCAVGRLRLLPEDPSRVCRCPLRF
jgi:lipopolysaccharide transport system permease protein